MFVFNLHYAQVGLWLFLILTNVDYHFESWRTIYSYFNFGL